MILLDASLHMPFDIPFSLIIHLRVLFATLRMSSGMGEIIPIFFFTNHLTFQAFDLILQVQLQLIFVDQDLEWILLLENPSHQKIDMDQ
jgi:hypothetical protein